MLKLRFISLSPWQLNNTGKHTHKYIPAGAHLGIYVMFPTFLPSGNLINIQNLKLKTNALTSSMQANVNITHKAPVCSQCVLVCECVWIVLLPLWLIFDSVAISHVSSKPRIKNIYSNKQITLCRCVQFALKFVVHAESTHSMPNVRIEAKPH